MELAINLTLEILINAKEHIKEFIGKDWFDKKIHEYDVYNRNLERSGGSTEKILRVHPLVKIVYESERSISNIISNSEPLHYDSLIQIFLLSSIFYDVEKVLNYEKHISRIKMAEQYDSSICELEVASILKTFCGRVEFVPEEKFRTPDLILFDGDEEIFIECKNVSVCNEVQGNNSKFWNQVLDFTKRLLQKRHLPLSVLYKSNSTVDYKDIGILRKELLSVLISINLNNGFERKIVQILDGKYEIVIVRSKIGLNSVDLSNIGIKPDFSIIEFLVDKSKKMNCIENLISVSYKSEVTIDYSSGIINAFNSGKGQIPEGKNGLIWIKIPDNIPKYYASELEKIKTNLKDKIRGTRNSRISGIVLYYNTMEVSHDNSRKTKFQRNIMKITRNA